MKDTIMLAAAAVIFIILVVFSSSKAHNAPVEVEDKDPFVYVCRSIGGKIVYHRDTKVMYSVSYYDVLTVLVNPDGSPMLWEG